MTERFGFLLLPGYSMLAFTGAVDQLRMANRISGKPLYEWVTVSQSNERVRASNGLSVYQDYQLDEINQFDLLFVCGGIDIDLDVNKSISRWLRQLAAKQTPLGSMCTGTYILAQAGLLNQRSCTIHWGKHVFP